MTTEASQPAEPEMSVAPGLVQTAMQGVALKIECEAMGVTPEEAKWVACHVSVLLAPLKGWKLSAVLLLFWAAAKVFVCWRAILRYAAGKRKKHESH